MEKLSIKEIFTVSLSVVLKHWKLLLLVFFVFIGLVILALLGIPMFFLNVAAILSVMLGENAKLAQSLIIVIGSMIGIFLGLIAFYALFGGIIKIALNIYETGNAKLRDIFSCPFGLAVRLLFASLLYKVLVFIGFAFLVIPGIFFMVIFSLFPYFIVDQGCGILDAFAKSSHLVKGNFFKILLIVIIGFFVPILFIPLILIESYLYLKLKNTDKKNLECEQCLP